MGQISITFAVPIWDLTEEVGPFTCVRVCDQGPDPRPCWHKHRTKGAAKRCARSLRLGESSGAINERVEIRSMHPAGLTTVEAERLVRKQEIYHFVGALLDARTRLDESAVAAQIARLNGRLPDGWRAALVGEAGEPAARDIELCGTAGSLPLDELVEDYGTVLRYFPERVVHEGRVLKDVRS